jgi:hypothetical protein
MPPPLFQVIVEAPGHNRAAREHLLLRLQQGFGSQLAGAHDKLSQGGIVLCKSPTLDEAKAKAEQARELGADFRILDAKGQLVLQGKAQTHAQQQVEARTLLGGFDRKENPSLDDTLLGPGERTTPFIKTAPAAQEAKLVFSAPRTGQSQPPPSLDGMESLDLMLLDGTSEERPADFSSGSDQLGLPTADAFAPSPDEDSLELDEVTPPPQSEAEPDRSEIALENETELPSVQQLAAEQRLPTAQPESPRSKGLTPAAKRAGASFLRRPRVLSFQLFDGWFQNRPRLRILVGFVLALGLGAILPTCHACSIYKARIAPQLEDLSTVKAHGPLLSHMPNYRSAEEIQTAISSVQHHSSLYTVVLWIFISGILGFVWFRFT